ncbi:AAA family ATPase [Companilactobacillus allii]|nr:AAA family ATPase [Companilactobacillus allii]USQ69873.1 AAA family ATPase [Companilactobacillus allii]
MGIAMSRMIKEINKKHDINIDLTKIDKNRDEIQAEKSLEFTRINNRNKRRKMFKSSLVSDSNDLYSTFDDFQTDKSYQVDELNKAKNIANRIYKGEIGNFLFTGKPGLGKTMLAVSILNGLNKLDNTDLSCLFVSFEMFMELKKNSFNDKSGFIRDDIYKLEQCIKNCDVLVLDDLGSETSFENDLNVRTGSQYTQETLFRIADYRKNKTNIITTNNDGRELQNMYHPKIISRLMTKKPENFIQFNGTDQRRG